MQARSPEGYKTVDPTRPIRAVALADSPVQAEPGEVLAVDTTLGDVTVILPDASRGGQDVQTLNVSGANNILVTPSPGTQAILTSGGPVINPATVAVPTTQGASFTPAGRGGILNWSALLADLF